MRTHLYTTARFVAMTLCAAMLAACGGGASNTPSGEPQPVLATQLPFTPLPQEELYGEWPVRTYVLRTEEEWIRAWDEHIARREPPPPRPPVDFTRSMVVGLSLGWGRDSCFSVKVLRVIEEPSAIRVEYRHKTMPPPGAYCAQLIVPQFDMVTISPRDKPVYFVEVAA